MLIRTLGRVDYEVTTMQMRAFTAARTFDTEDELWIVEHAPVFTQGVAGKPEHLLSNPEQIPIIKTDRGGQITYHGPGQVVIYLLFDLRRAGYGVREMVTRIESAVITLLAQHGIYAYGKRDAPGVYVNDAKIASLGLKIRNGATYHGVALNVDMDLAPFACINPCGYAGLQVVDMRRLAVERTPTAVADALAEALRTTLNVSKYNANT